MKNAFLKTARHTGIALLAAVLTAPALAQDEDAAPAYQVEVIIFRNLDQSRTTPEVAPQAEAPLDQVLEQQLARLGDATATAALPAATAPAWLPVPREALLLDADARRLARTQTYAVVAHLAWVQPAADVALAEPYGCTANATCTWVSISR